jgi:hypothetical protein
MPTSCALDGVAKKLGIPCFEVSYLQHHHRTFLLTSL